MADEKRKIKEYFDGVQPSEDFTRRLLELEQRERAPEAAPRPIPLRRRWALAAIAAVMVLVSLAARSDAMTALVALIAAAYLGLLILLLRRVSFGKKKKS